MAKKVIISLAGANSREQVEITACKVAEHLGLDRADVLVLSNAAVTVVDQDEPKVVDVPVVVPPVVNTPAAPVVASTPAVSSTKKVV